MPMRHQIHLISIDLNVVTWSTAISILIEIEEMLTPSLQLMVLTRACGNESYVNKTMDTGVCRTRAVPTRCATFQLGVPTHICLFQLA